MCAFHTTHPIPRVLLVQLIYYLLKWNNARLKEHLLDLVLSTAGNITLIDEFDPEWDYQFTIHSPFCSFTIYPGERCLLEKRLFSHFPSLSKYVFVKSSKKHFALEGRFLQWVNVVQYTTVWCVLCI